MKKTIFLSFIITMMFGFIPITLAASKYGTVKDITKEAGDSLTTGEGAIETKGNTTTIRYEAATFKMLEASEETADGERPGPAAWIGFEISEPTDDSDSSFKVTTPDNKVTENKKTTFRDYVGITPENLKKVLLNGTMLSYKYGFDWDEDGTNDQFVIIEVDPEEMTLIDSKGNDKVWTPEMAEEILDEQIPDTSDISLVFVISLIIVGSLGFIYCKKRV